MCIFEQLFLFPSKYGQANGQWEIRERERHKLEGKKKVIGNQSAAVFQYWNARWYLLKDRRRRVKVKGWGAEKKIENSARRKRKYISGYIIFTTIWLFSVSLPFPSKSPKKVSPQNAISSTLVERETKENVRASVFLSEFTRRGVREN